MPKPVLLTVDDDGDVRHGSPKRVASGVGEGSVAISFVHQYLSNVRA